MFICPSWTKGFLVQQPFSPWWCSTLLIVDLHTLVPDASTSLTSTFVVVLGFSWPFQTKVCSSLGVNLCLLPEWCSLCVTPIFFLYLHTIVRTDARGAFRCLEIAHKEELVLCLIQLFSEDLAKLLWIFSWYQRQKGKRMALKVGPYTLLIMTTVQAEASKVITSIAWIFQIV